jgi:hypothetical protein
VAVRVVLYEPGMQHMRRLAANLAHAVTDLIYLDVLSDVNYDTGALFRSVRTQKLKWSGRVWIGTDHWFFIEYGVHPHIIRTRTKRTLANPDTRQMYGQRVRHPGHRAYMPMRRALYKRRFVVKIP